MMLELLMARQSERDRMVMANAEGLDFLVLDELHTYRGRQGADVAMLVRRVRDRLYRQKTPICIGTSATMASEGEDSTRAKAVAQVASRLFGTRVAPDAVVDESLERATDPRVRILPMALSVAVQSPIPSSLDDEILKTHPLAIWIELEIGLNDGQRLSRREPITIEAASTRLAERSGCEIARLSPADSSNADADEHAIKGARRFRGSSVPSFQTPPIHLRGGTCLCHSENPWAAPNHA
jgi:hypothetical protein